MKRQPYRMASSVTAPHNTGCRRRSWDPVSQGDTAFSLIEIMVAMALLTVIVLGLMAMFNQTQRAFRQGVTQTDVLEAGRMATDMLVRELEQTTPSYQPYTVNFYAGIPSYAPSQLVLPSTPNIRTNILGELFFLTRANQAWSGVGYFVRTNPAYFSGLAPVGSLYRFEMDKTAVQFSQNPANLFFNYWNSTNNPPTTNVSKVLDGIVQFRVRTYDTNGIWMDGIWRSNATNAPNIGVREDYPSTPGEVNFYGFTNNAVPAYVEVELGVLEPAVLARYNSIPDPLIASNFLATHSGAIHLFRQRVTIRNIDRTAYQ